MIIWITDKGRVQQEDASVDVGTAIITYKGPDATIKGAECGTRRWEVSRPCHVKEGFTIVLSNSFGV